MAGEDKAYCEWLLRQGCACCEREYRLVVHHHTRGTTAPLFPVEGEPLGGTVGGYRAHDHWGIPLCSTGGLLGCHEQLHLRVGAFRVSLIDDVIAWQDERVRELRNRYLDDLVF